MVQRYLMAKTDEAAFRAVPVWDCFMLIGTCVWGYYQVSGTLIPATVTKADQMFPFFLRQHLPPGVPGLLLACLTGSTMTMLASDLNSMAVVAVEDF